MKRGGGKIRSIYRNFHFFNVLYLERSFYHSYDIDDHVHFSNSIWYGINNLQNSILRRPCPLTTLCIGRQNRCAACFPKQSPYAGSNTRRRHAELCVIVRIAGRKTGTTLGTSSGWETGRGEVVIPSIAVVVAATQAEVCAAGGTG